MAMAGQGFNAQPPPRPSSHNYGGSGGGGANPGNQLYVGNVSTLSLPLYIVHAHIIRSSYRIKRVGKTLKISSVLLEISSAPTLTLAPMVVPKDLARSYLRLPKMLSKQSVSALQGEGKSVIDLNELGMYNGFEWYGRTLEVREVRVLR